MTADFAARIRALRRRAVAVTVGVAIAAGVMGYVLSRPPAWWNPPSRVDPVAVVAGEKLENACVTEVHRVRPRGESWAVRVRDDDVNAWIATRLPKWLEHSGTVDAPQAMVRFRPDRIEIGARVEGVPSVSVLRCSPRMENGRLRLDGLRTRLGDLPLPFVHGILTRELAAALESPDAPDELRALAALLAGEAAAPRFSLGDGRIVELRNIEVDEGELRLEFVTELEGGIPGPRR
ncbi:MAG: hypothetical protein JNM94_03435 [Phycisphaerae bacterium]|nr:hypothetical protein [Phycisphaerae bacterium]